MLFSLKFGSIVTRDGEAILLGEGETDCESS
jgi:hypothetical protein